MNGKKASFGLATGIAVFCLICCWPKAGSSILDWALPVSLGIFVLGLPTIYQRAKAEAVPSKRTDVIGYLFIAWVLVAAVWLALRLTR